MTGPEIACDTEFTAGTGGQLQLRGPVRDVAWPYSNAGPASAGGLFTDPDAGLWTPRRDPVVGDLDVTLSAGRTGVAAGKQYVWPYQQVTVTNPSPAQRAVLLCNWYFEWSVDIYSGAVADVHTSIIRMDARTTPNWKHGATNANVTKNTTPNPAWTWISSRTEVDTEYLEPGQASTYRIQIRVLCGTNGSLVANSAHLAIKMLGLLM